MDIYVLLSALQISLNSCFYYINYFAHWPVRCVISWGIMMLSMVACSNDKNVPKPGIFPNGIHIKMETVNNRLSYMSQGKRKNKANHQPIKAKQIINRDPRCVEPDHMGIIKESKDRVLERLLRHQVHFHIIDANCHEHRKRRAQYAHHFVPRQVRCMWVAFRVSVSMVRKMHQSPIVWARLSCYTTDVRQDRFPDSISCV